MNRTRKAGRREVACMISHGGGVTGCAFSLPKPRPLTLSEAVIFPLHQCFSQAFTHLDVSFPRSYQAWQVVLLNKTLCH